MNEPKRSKESEVVRIHHCGLDPCSRSTVRPLNPIAYLLSLHLWQEGDKTAWAGVMNEPKRAKDAVRAPLSTHLTNPELHAGTLCEGTEWTTVQP
jgi:hypothetical protein